MSSMEARRPPRFVPTLTDVVPEPVGQRVPDAAAEPVMQAESVVQLVQPLPTHGAQKSETTAATAEATVSPQSMPPLGLEAAAHTLQEKVMARLDVALEERMRYALADMVQLHTQALYQAIRQDLETLVSASVHEAVAQELAQMRQQTKA